MSLVKSKKVAVLVAPARERGLKLRIIFTANI